MPVEPTIEIWGKGNRGELTLQGWILQDSDGYHVGFRADTNVEGLPTILGDYLEKQLGHELDHPPHVWRCMNCKWWERVKLNPLGGTCHSEMAGQLMGRKRITSHLFGCNAFEGKEES